MNTGERGHPWSLPSGIATDALVGHVPPAIALILAKREIDTPEKLRAFLVPPHKLPHEPLRITGMEIALKRLYSAVKNHEKVGVFGDFDVDGITGTAIICEGLTSLGVTVFPYLPHRVDEGHGLSNAAIDTLSKQGVTLIITVDTGGLYEFYGQPWDPGLLELAAMGTISDLVPLLDENRYIVQEGLRQLANTGRPGLQALYRLARVEADSITAETVSFQIAPRLNSAGRMGDPMDSYNLLTTDSQEEASALTQKLESLNMDRRAITEETYTLANSMVEEMNKLPSVIVVSDERFLRGVAGLIAGRLVDKYRRPAIVIAIEGELSVASGRSIPEFNILAAIESCEHLLVRFGGHSQAAGLTMATESIPQLKSHLANYNPGTLEINDLVRQVDIDAVIGLDELDDTMVRWINDLEPYGPANPRPTFASMGVKVLETYQMGRERQHLRLLVENNGSQFTALAFNQAEKWQASTEFVDLAFTVMNDSFRGKGAIALRLLDFRPSP